MMNRLKFVLLNLFVLNVATHMYCQPDRWQQMVDYKMEIDFDYRKNQFEGKQILKYTNNSPDTLDRVFYHLYFNAFQPGSVMDVRSRTIADPDRRVGHRISLLKKAEQGYQEIKSLKMNGKNVDYKTVGTILEVNLREPIMPKSTVTFEMEFHAQVPLQIRRTGRFNTEGIEYSMAQWYPKMCNYDYQGWHANPYVGREFYGIWGDFDVKITIDSQYMVAATGILQNKDKIGKGYSSKPVKLTSKKITWHFKAEKVHDFVWAADPDYVHTTHLAQDGTLLRFFYQPGEKTTENWEKLPAIMDECLQFLNRTYGIYPYPEYAFIQGGDGGMEYPMATLITGERPLVSLVGVSVHELIHSWYQGVLASNEALYHWMDEGFTSFAQEEAMNYLRMKKLIPGTAVDNPQLQSVKGYINFALSGKEEPLIIHADHFITNTAYGMASYTKGQVFLEQLRYIIGKDAFDKTMLRYYNDWKFRHPNANDFIRVAEKVSGLELDWFKEYFVHTTHTIDYSVEEMYGKTIVLKRNGIMPMPLDIVVTDNDGKEYRYNVPLDLMRGAKKGDRFFNNFSVREPWPWTHPEYRLEVDIDARNIKLVKIDPSQRLADVNRADNHYPRVELPGDAEK
jgi:hypothetical protein